MMIVSPLVTGYIVGFLTWAIPIGIIFARQEIHWRQEQLLANAKIHRRASRRERIAFYEAFMKRPDIPQHQWQWASEKVADLMATDRRSGEHERRETGRQPAVLPATFHYRAPDALPIHPNRHGAPGFVRAITRYLERKV